MAGIGVFVNICCELAILSGVMQLSMIISWNVPLYNEMVLS